MPSKKKGTYQGKAESPQGLGQQKLPCNCVTNPLGPTTRLYPINTREKWGSGPFRPHTLVEGGRPCLESVINSPISSYIVSRSLLSRSGIRTTGRTSCCCDEPSRTWALLSPETRCVISVKDRELKSQCGLHGFTRNTWTITWSRSKGNLNKRPERLKPFITGAGEQIKHIRTSFKNDCFFISVNTDSDGMVALLDFCEDGVIPYMIFVKDGLEMEKCEQTWM